MVSVSRLGSCVCFTDQIHWLQPIRASAPADCIERLAENTALIDSLLSLNSSLVTPSLKSFFGLSNVTADADFVNALALPLGSWQARNWDGTVGSSRFDAFCDALTGNTSSLSTPARPIDAALLEGLDGLALPKDPRKTLASMSTYAAYVKEHIAALCPPDELQDACFGTDEYSGDGLDEYEWKSWAWQFCSGAPQFLATSVARREPP